MLSIANSLPPLLSLTLTTSNLKLPDLFLKIVLIAQKHFHLGENSFMTAYGLKEMIFDKPQTKPLNTSATAVQQVVYHFFQARQIDVAPFSPSQMHGIYYISAGLLGGITTLQSYGIADLGLASPLLSSLSHTFFGCANWHNLLYHVQCFHDADLLASDRSQPTQEAVRRIKASAVLGIISSVGYLATLAASLFGPFAWIPMIFGGVAMLTGCIKILYDFFWLYKA